MRYKSLCLEMIQDRPQLYDQLLKDRNLLPELDRYARGLKESHEHYKAVLARSNPSSSPEQIAMEAAELALSDLQDSLQSGFPASSHQSPPENRPA